MNDGRRIERALPTILADLGAGTTNDYTTLLARTARTRQRRAWTFPERWLPVEITARPLPVAIPPRRLLVAVALLLLAAAVAIAIVGSRSTRLPAPFGLAQNGLIAYVDLNGAIHVADPMTGTSKEIIPPGGNDRPRFSPDGTRIAYLHDRNGGAEIVVARADGTVPNVVSPSPLYSAQYFEWAPDSRSVMLVTDGGAIERFDADKPGDPYILVPRSGVDGDPGIQAFNSLVAGLYRPPKGDQILYLESRNNNNSDDTLVVANADGSGARTLVDDPRIEDIISRSWSPDGTRIAFVAAPPDDLGSFHTWIVNADGSGLHRLLNDDDPVTDRTDGNPAWSPDGTRIAMQRWYRHPDGGQDFRPVSIVDVSTGRVIEVGETYTNGLSFAWSPDGRSLLEVPGDDSNRMLVVDATTGILTTTKWATGDTPSWQRTAP